MDPDAGEGRAVAPISPRSFRNADRAFSVAFGKLFLKGIAPLAVRNHPLLSILRFECGKISPKADRNQLEKLPLRYDDLLSVKLPAFRVISEPMHHLEAREGLVDGKFKFDAIRGILARDNRPRQNGTHDKSPEITHKLSTTSGTTGYLIQRTLFIIYH